MKYFYILISIFSINIYANENLSVKGYLELLTGKNEPTLAQYAKFSGECGGENELDYIFHICKKKQYDIYSKECVNITHTRCENSNINNSYFLDYIRTKFQTVGKTYKLIKTEKFLKGMEFELVEVKIGKNIFIVFHSLDEYPPAGNFIDITSINGKKIEMLMPE